MLVFLAQAIFLKYEFLLKGLLNKYRMFKKIMQLCLEFRFEG